MKAKEQQRRDPGTKVSLSLGGEANTYLPEQWSSITLAQACGIIGDLTGYKPEYLLDAIEFDRLGYATVGRRVERHGYEVADLGLLPLRFMLRREGG